VNHHCKTRICRSLWSSQLSKSRDRLRRIESRSCPASTASSSRLALDRNRQRHHGAHTTRQQTSTPPSAAAPTTAAVPNRSRPVAADTPGNETTSAAAVVSRVARDRRLSSSACWWASARSASEKTISRRLSGSGPDIQRHRQATQQPELLQPVPGPQQRLLARP